MCLSLSDYITPSGFCNLLHSVGYNHFNPSGLVNIGFEADIQKGLAELKEFV